MRPLEKVSHRACTLHSRIGPDRGCIHVLADLGQLYLKKRSGAVMTRFLLQEVQVQPLLFSLAQCCSTVLQPTCSAPSSLRLFCDR